MTERETERPAPPSDEDVDECVVQLLSGAGEPQTYDALFGPVAAAVIGSLTHNQFIGRVLALRGAKRVRMVQHKVNGKGKARSCYCLPEHEHRAFTGNPKGYRRVVD